MRLHQLNCRSRLIPFHSLLTIRLLGIVVASALLTDNLPNSSSLLARELRSFAPTLSEDYEFFGFSSDLSDGILVSGAPGGNDFAGRAYLFNAETGTELFRLKPPVSAANDFFGFATSLGNSSVLVGDPGSSFPPVAQPAGRVYSFDRTNGTLQGEFIPPNRVTRDEFGFSLDVVGNQALIGAPAAGVGIGKAHLFDAATRTHIAQLRASDESAGYEFGYAISSNGTTALVGAPGNSETLGAVKGAVYVFNVSNVNSSTINELVKIMPNDSSLSDEFGYSVSVEGNLAVIGAPQQGLGSGAAYIYDISNPASPQQLFKIKPTDSVTGNDFGTWVDIDGTTVIVGAPGGDGVAGGAYLFDALTGTQLRKLTPQNLQTNGEFGFTVALDNRLAVVGGPAFDFLPTRYGTEFVFNGSPLGPADINMDGTVDAGDAEIMFGNWASDDVAADINGDGIVDAGDAGIMFEVWTGDAGPVSVPEPATCGLLLAAAFAARRFSQR